MSKNLRDWLAWQETLHPSEIDLGLQRVSEVLHRLIPECITEFQQFKQPYTVITIAGTNGKGSTVAMLEAILTEAGYKVGSFTSPHLCHYNERIKINREPVSEQSLCDSFQRIDQARAELSITYFEFSALAAIDIFYKQSCDIAILEVGLGGRLDAVNIIDADVALVTTVDIDHQDWLGSDREAIAIEKAGIYRKDKPAIYGDSDLPKSIRAIVDKQNLTFYQYSVDYQDAPRDQHSTEQQWDWVIPELIHDNTRSLLPRYNLPIPNLMGSAQLKNASNVLMALDLIKKSYPVTQAEIKRGLYNVELAGRFQVVSTQPFVILDVAHNVQAVKVLRDSLASLKKQAPGKLNVIVGMLSDKDVSDVLAVLAPFVNSWRIIELDTPRAMPAKKIELLLNNKQLIDGLNPKIQCFSNFEQAYQDFISNQLTLNSIDTLLVFGSFFTVTDALNFFQSSDTIMTHE